MLAVYGVRWQIELAFKLCKSEAQLETTRATEPHRVECEFYAKLITVLLFNRLSGLAAALVGEPLSPTKLWRQLRGDWQDLRRVLGHGTAQALSELLKLRARFAKPARGQQQPSTRQRLELAGQAARQVRLSDPLAYLREKKRNVAERSQVFARYLTSYQVTLKSKRLGYQRTVSVP